MELPISVDRKEVLAENTYILTLDGDIDFQPPAVSLLVDLMKKNRNLGAACGRIHPVGSGPMVWYQLFEYAIGHWLQKATEHMIGKSSPIVQTLTSFDSFAKLYNKLNLVDLNNTKNQL
jgi:chitin synthase